MRGNTAMIEFTGLGDFETFQCNLDREGFKNCKTKMTDNRGGQWQ